ncbi:N-acyl homoserine lactonase family protein [Mycolicibacterium goodii]|uniref:N-acyl homoserine lactonase family protein n=1 Tax=Mycolicibacterium goodii TaxID=134601 RepID=UPI0006735E3E
MTDSEYEVVALRYAFREDGTASSTYYAYEVYGEADHSIASDYYIFVARNDFRTVLVDCGYSPRRARERGRTLTALPEELLARMGIAPEDVDHVVLTHMHWDHVGNTGLFPNATFSIARSEYESVTGPYGRRPCIGVALGDEELEAVKGLELAGRLYQVPDGGVELFPGIRLVVAPGHTPGQLLTDVTTSTGSVVLASDALHFYDEMALDRPFWVFTDLAGMYRTYELLRSYSARPNTVVVPGHDPAVTTHFREIAENCFDLTTPLSGTA